jgi:hypothetical protein
LHTAEGDIAVQVPQVQVPQVQVPQVQVPQVQVPQVRDWVDEGPIV